MEPEGWQQYYPTYRFKKRDILLKEFEASANNVQSQERLYQHSANFVLLFGAIINSLLLGRLNNILGYLNNYFGLFEILLISMGFIFIFSIIILKYFADRQKAILFDTRKVVVLRTMLGLDYGSLQLVLPNWRIEGATNPYAIKLFPGWFSYVAYPFWLISLFTSLLVFLLMRITSKDIIYSVSNDYA